MLRAFSLIAIFFALVSPVTAGDENVDVDALWKQSKDGDESAYKKLIDLGPESRILAERLVEVLCHTQEDESDFGAGRLLIAMQADAVPAIVAALEESFPDDQKKLLTVLKEIGPMARGAGDAVLKIAIDEPGEIHEQALETLASAQSKKDYVIPELIRLLSKTSPGSDAIRPLVGGNRRAEFAASLLARCPDDRALRPLIQAVMFHPSAQVRQFAVESLAKIYPDDPSVIRVLINALDDNAGTGLGLFMGSPAQTASECILRYEELPADAASRLIARLYRASFETSGASPRTLCEAICRCPTTDKAADALVKHKLRALLPDDALIISNQDPRGAELERKRMRVAAASVVLKWDLNDRVAADLLARVADEDTHQNFDGPKGSRFPDVRAEAVRGLGRASITSRARLPLLQRIMERESQKHVPPARPSELAFDAAWAIAQIDRNDEKCLTVLKQADWEYRLRHISWPRFEAVLGKRAAQFVDIDDALNKLQDLEGMNAVADSWEWHKLRPHFTVVGPVLFRHLDSDRIAMQCAALKVLPYFPTESETIIPKVVESLRDSRATTRAAAAVTLGKFKNLPRDARSALEQATRDNFLTVRFSAEDALASSGRVTKE